MTQQTNAIAPEDVMPGVWLIDPNGNLICVHFPDFVRKTGTWMVQIDDELQTRHRLSECSGIALSEKVLELCGWVFNTECNSYEGKHARMNLQFSDISGSYTMFNYVLKALIAERIYYLHELQNLYRSLTRTDLEIDPAQLAEAVKGKNT